MKGRGEARSVAHFSSIDIEFTSTLSTIPFKENDCPIAILNAFTHLSTLWSPDLGGLQATIFIATTGFLFSRPVKAQPWTMILSTAEDPLVHQDSVVMKPLQHTMPPSIPVARGLLRSSIWIMQNHKAIQLAIEIIRLFLQLAVFVPCRELPVAETSTVIGMKTNRAVRVPSFPRPISKTFDEVALLTPQKPIAIEPRQAWTMKLTL